jgi:SAM-dependent methyltransferase
MAEFANLYADGSAYERMMGRFSGIAGGQFADWLRLPPGLRWLDVGCGTGAFTEVIVRRCAPALVTGIDPSEPQLSFARGRPALKMAQFQVGDAEDLPLADNSFDVAAMALVFSLLSDPVKAAVQMRRVVRPGGCVAAYMWDIPGGGLPTEPVYAAMRSLGLDPPQSPGAANSAREKMRAVWKEAGIGSIESCVIEVPVTYASFDEFWQAHNVPVGHSGAAIGRLSPDLKEKLKSTLRQRLTGTDGRIVYKAFANAVKGKAPG